MNAVITATLEQAQEQLNDRINKALLGEQVVLVRGVEQVAAIVPLHLSDSPSKDVLSDAAADRLWRRLAAERESGRLSGFDSPKEAVRALAQ